MAAVPPDLAFNTAVSFATNTNWQAYASERNCTQIVVGRARRGWGLPMGNISVAYLMTVLLVAMKGGLRPAILTSDMPLLCLDAVLMEQAFFNLLDNACKYAPAGSSVKVWALKTPKHIAIEVADQGPGIPVEALDRGANDYIVKPFGIAELMARVRAVLRAQAPKSIDDVVSVGPVTIDLTRLVVTKDGAEIHLSRKEWELLAFLARRPDHVLTHRHILKEVWGAAHTDDTAYLRVYVNQLRQKLEADPAQPTLIVTDSGVGYRLKA